MLLLDSPPAHAALSRADGGHSRAHRSGQNLTADMNACASAPTSAVRCFCGTGHRNPCYPRGARTLPGRGRDHRHALVGEAEFHERAAADRGGRERQPQQRRAQRQIGDQVAAVRRALPVQLLARKVVLRPLCGPARAGPQGAGVASLTEPSLPVRRALPVQLLARKVVLWPLCVTQMQKVKAPGSPVASAPLRSANAEAKAPRSPPAALAPLQSANAEGQGTRVPSCSCTGPSAVR